MITNKKGGYRRRKDQDQEGERFNIGIVVDKDGRQNQWKLEENEEREGNRGMKKVGRMKSNVGEIRRRRKDKKKNG